MTEDTVEVVTFVDSDTKEEAAVIVRVVNRMIALTVTLENDGDTAAIFDVETSERVLLALQAAIHHVKSLD